MKILIAEDDMVSRRVLEATLQKWGHEVVVAHDGVAALSVLQSEDAPPLAVLDWMMRCRLSVKLKKNLSASKHFSKNRRLRKCLKNSIASTLSLFRV